MKEPLFRKPKLPAICFLTYTAMDAARPSFFAQLGFAVETWEELAQALRQHLADNEIAKIES